MWQYFWKYQTDIPPGIGVIQNSPEHLTWVIAVLILILIAAIYYRKQSTPKRRRMELIIAACLISGYIIRWIWVVIIGHFEADDMLPLHLCSLSAMVGFAAVLTRKPLLKEIGYACGLPGALVTFIVPNFGNYPLWHIYYLVFILDHAILILLPIIWTWADGFRPNIHRLLRVFALLMITAGIDVLINKILGSNFMFLGAVPSDAPFKPAADWLGSPAYQFVMAVILLIVWAILYGPWLIVSKKRQMASQAPDNF